MSARLVYLRLELKRACKKLPHIFAGAIVLLLLAGTIALLSARMLYGETSSGRITVGVVLPEGDAVAKKALAMVSSLESVKSICDFEYMNKEECLDKLKAGKLYAVMEVPEGFVQDIMNGTNTPVKILLPKGAGLESRIFKELTDAGASTLGASQAGIYAGDELLYLYGCFLSGFAAWCSQMVKQFIFSHIICQQFPIVYLHKGCKHSLRGESRSHGGRSRIYADRTLIGFGIQFLLQSGIYHITAFRPPGRHFCLYLFLVTAQIETEHSRILSSRPVHKAVRQGITQGVLPALFHTDGYAYVLASLFLGLAGCQHPGRKEQEDEKKGPFSHISLA